MELNTQLPDRPRISPEERRARELVKKIRKLKWIGMHDEAQRLETDLCRLDSGLVVLSGPAETD
ncbi:MAG TPA: hypothetical protein VLW75_11495 [Rhizomicrobium sp.]|nr:hypothetical protein [Rhizomicrobium sp.]